MDEFFLAIVLLPTVGLLLAVLISRVMRDLLFWQVFTLFEGVVTGFLGFSTLFQPKVMALDYAHMTMSQDVVVLGVNIGLTILGFIRWRIAIEMEGEQADLDRLRQLGGRDDY